MGNLIVYPALKSSYENCKDDPTLIFVPQEIEKKACGSFVCPETRRERIKIPCRYIPCQTRSSPYLIMFFHGNSEDIGSSLSELLLSFVERFEMDVICPEYPSYGIYKERDDTLTMEQAILNDARQVLRYCKSQLRFNYENIILIGRSLGTGVVVRMAVEFKVMGSVLISPFTAIKEVAKVIVGNLLSRFAPDAFRSIDYIDQIKSPILIIHGKEDSLIPYQMAVDLYDKAPEGKMLKLNKDMEHNKFKLEADLFTPIHKFLEKELELGPYLFTKIRMLKELFEPRCGDTDDVETNLEHDELGFA